MTANRKKPAFRMLFLIATPKLTKKAEELFKEGNVPMQYRFHGQGTASSEIMDILGLGGIEKNILISMMPKVFADEILRKLKKKLYLGAPGTGIAFTIAMSGGSGRMFKLMEAMHLESDGPSQARQELMNHGFERRELQRGEMEMAENEYALIMTIVNQGYSEDVMNAARPQGASGGTVFHSRRIGSKEAMKFWGISVQQEREIVLILAKKEEKMPIMKAIGENCGMQTEANGIVLSLPVDGVVGVDYR